MLLYVCIYQTNAGTCSVPSRFHNAKLPLLFICAMFLSEKMAPGRIFHEKRAFYSVFFKQQHSGWHVSRHSSHLQCCEKQLPQTVKLRGEAATPTAGETVRQDTTHTASAAFIEKSGAFVENICRCWHEALPLRKIATHINIATQTSQHIQTFYTHKHTKMLKDYEKNWNIQEANHFFHRSYGC